MKKHILLMLTSASMLFAGMTSETYASAQRAKQQVQHQIQTAAAAVVPPGGLLLDAAEVTQLKADMLALVTTAGIVGAHGAPFQPAANPTAVQVHNALQAADAAMAAGFTAPAVGGILNRIRARIGLGAAANPVNDAALGAGQPANDDVITRINDIIADANHLANLAYTEVGIPYVAVNYAAGGPHGAANLFQGKEAAITAELARVVDDAIGNPHLSGGAKALKFGPLVVLMRTGLHDLEAAAIGGGATAAASWANVKATINTTGAVLH
jgi:hypothetical protein